MIVAEHSTVYYPGRLPIEKHNWTPVVVIETTSIVELPCPTLLVIKNEVEDRSLGHPMNEY